MTASAVLSPATHQAAPLLKHRTTTCRHVFVVCSGDSCRHAGSELLLGMLQRGYSQPGEGQDVRISSSKCLQRCGAAPAMVNNGRVMGWVSPRGLKSELLRLGLFPAAA